VHDHESDVAALLHPSLQLIEALAVVDGRSRWFASAASPLASGALKGGKKGPDIREFFPSGDHVAGMRHLKVLNPGPQRSRLWTGPETSLPQNLAWWLRGLACWGAQDMQASSASCLSLMWACPITILFRLSISDLPIAL